MPRPRRRRRRRWVRWAVPCAILCLLAVGVYFAWPHRFELVVRYCPARIVRRLAERNPWKSWWWDAHMAQLRRAMAREESAYETRQAAVQRELAALGDHPWAGTYDKPAADYARTLWLAPPGFAYYYWTLRLQAWNYGEVEELSPTRIRLRPVLDPDVFTLELQSDYFVVKWADWTFLISPPEMPSFLNAVNQQNDALLALRFLHRRAAPPSGRDRYDYDVMPEVPEEFRRHLLREERIVNVLELRKTDTLPSDPGWADHRVTLLLDIGSRDGAFVGMALCHVDRHSGPFFERAYLTAVEPKVSEAVFVHTARESDTVELPGRGFKFSTRSPVYKALRQPRDRASTKPPDTAPATSQSSSGD